MLDPLLSHQIDFNAPFWIGKQVVIDSRHIVDYPNSLFFALSGNKTDGHQFIQSLHEKGVQHFVVNESFNGQIPERCLFRTNHVRDVLQQFAAYHRMQFTYPVIGITGSNGKTTLKECIFEMLHSDFNVIKSPKSYNSQIGVPLSVFGMSAENNLAIFEAGISQVDEMKHLQQIIRPTIGIFTNIGDAHSSGFDSQSQKLAEKLQLFSECDLVIYNNDIPHIEEYTHSINPNGKKLVWSYHETKEADFHVVTKEDNYYLTGTFNQQTYNCHIPFNNPAFIENTTNAIVLMIYLNYTEHQIQEKVNSLSLNTARLSIKEGIQDSLLIDDTYNNDFEGLKVALDFMNRQYKQSIHSRKTLILSDFQDTKTSSIYKKTLALLRANPVDRIILVGTQFKSHIHQFRSICYTTYYPSTLQLLEQIASIPFNKEVVLIKGPEPTVLSKSSID